MSPATVQFYMMLVATVVGGTASVATCGFVIYMFKRVYASHDKLAKAVDELAHTVSDFKLQVSGDYVTIASCREHREKCEAWKARVEEDIRKIRAQSSHERQRLGERMTRLETQVDVQCPPSRKKKEE